MHAPARTPRPCKRPFRLALPCCRPAASTTGSSISPRTLCSGAPRDTSYILAFDDLLGINRLQSVLCSDKLQHSPIDLLTLSACETAEGNDRAPLGIAGAAMRAWARSVLGTPRPVDDDAARQLTELFYRGLAIDGRSKAAALRDAQVELLRKPANRHPGRRSAWSAIGDNC
ncbi:CHAT domain-containing protein [Caenimonas sedimenti]|uniref:CHAT domain-containing protein n=1 Tax=Caenimonas sedimenti TaxID=2596921 RepID=UPI002104A5C2|nr:CHAT domain-containing protein [Caenimonas sedimenti]